MSLLKGSVGIMRFRVNGDLPKAGFWDFVANQIQERAFRDIDDSFEEVSVGWVSVVNMFDSEFKYASYAAGDYVALGLRVDERKVPADLVNKFSSKEEERVKKDRQLPKLSRAQRLEIKENIKLKLLKQTPPSTKVHDLIWDVGNSLLYFFSTQQKAFGVLEDFFHDTFGLQLTLLPPYLVAEQILSKDKLEALAELTPSIITI